MKKVWECLCVCAFMALSQLAIAQKPGKTFTNPILPEGADPWVVFAHGYYYYPGSGGNSLTLRKTRSMASLAQVKLKTIWTADTGKAWSKEIWAPELHLVDGKWYMYFAADDGKNDHHRIYVLENSASDPMSGTWKLKGQVRDADNKWAIDASVFRQGHKLYMIWSGWEGDTNGQQNIYIASMKNPYTIEGKRVRVSSPQYPWEEHGDLNNPGNPAHVNVNEGPEMLQHGGKLFLVYSASGCWTDNYSLGMLSASASANLMDPRSWKKSASPVFGGNSKDSVYAPGHNAFFKSPDGKQDWIIYHANPGPGCGCDGKRSPRMQQFTWNRDGTPDFGRPVSIHRVLSFPSEK